MHRRHPNATPVGEGDPGDHSVAPPLAPVSAAEWHLGNGYEGHLGMEGLKQVEWVALRCLVYARSV